MGIVTLQFAILPRIFGSFTMESILAAAFGRMVNIQDGEGDQLTEAAACIFGGAQEGSSLSFDTLIPILDHFPLLGRMIRIFVRSHLPQGRSFEILQSTAIQLVRERRKENASGDSDKTVPMNTHLHFCANNVRIFT